MSGTGELKMSIRRISAALIAGVMLLPVSASAQEVSQQRIITSLDNAGKVAPQIDVELLRQQAAQNPAGNASSLPDWAKLAQLSQLVVELNFVNNSVAMEPESYRTLARSSFLIVGHTSSTGDAKHNLQLSEDRANAIKLALSTTFAIKPERLFAVGAGQEYPIDATNPASAVNRRVQLFNLGLLK